MEQNEVQWSKIPDTGTKYYQISNTGLFRIFFKEKLEVKDLKATLHQENGLLRGTMQVDGKTKGIYIHKAVATAFVPNPDNLTRVRHKDGDKSNNHFTNLEWY